jgi:hypothetical protein
MKLKLLIVLLNLLSFSVCLLRKRAKDGLCPTIKFVSNGVNINLNLECKYLQRTRKFLCWYRTNFRETFLDMGCREYGSKSQLLSAYPIY